MKEQQPRYIGTPEDVLEALRFLNTRFDTLSQALGETNPQQAIRIVDEALGIRRHQERLVREVLLPQLPRHEGLDNCS